MSITTAKEYREKRERLVTLPSGAVFKVRGMPPLVFFEFLKLLDVDWTKLSQVSPEEAAKLSPEELKAKLKEFQFEIPRSQAAAKTPELAKLLIPKVVIEPRVVESEAKENEIPIDSLTFDDLWYLFKAGMEISGLGKVDFEERESFRKQ